MEISSIGFGNKEGEYVTVENRIIPKITQLGKDTLDYLVQHKYALAVGLWSYIAIEVGAIAVETLQKDYVYDVDSCRERLCNYWNNSTMFDSGFAPKYLESRCRSNKEVSHLSYSFMKCLQDLCKYTKSIGEKFYACPKLPELSNKIVNFWDTICPKKDNKHPNTLSQLSYLNKCIKKLCNSKKISPILNNNLLEVCETKSLENLYELLEKISKSLKKLQKSTENPNSWTQAGIIGSVVGGVTGIIGGAAGIATTIITYQAGQAATAAFGAIPTLSLGLQRIARTTTDTVVALMQQTTSDVAGMIPSDAVDALNELSSNIEEHSMSYYSAEETSPHKVESGNPGNINEVVDAFGGIDTKNAKADYLFDTAILPIREISHITEQWISYMKNTLPDWQNSFCFYERSLNLFTCRLPLPRHRTESQISFFLMEIHKFFSENIDSLCHYFHADLWCNWNHFLNLIFSHRNISFFWDMECPWDEFALKINEVQHDTYRGNAIGGCYNETFLIKV